MSSSDAVGNDLSPKPVFDRADLLERLDHDEPLLQEILETFVEDISVQIDSLDKAVDKEDATLLRSLGHMIKGASGNIGALAMQEVSFRLEMAAKDGDLEKAAAALAKLKSEFGRFRDHVGK